MSLSKRIILILSLCVFVGCGIYIGKYYYDCHKASEKISKIQHLADSVGSASGSGNQNSNQGNSEERDQYAQNGMILGYYKAYQQNNDMVGWIRLPGTKINYPVMQQKDNNDYYLHRDFEGKYQYSGLPFMDYQCDLNMPGGNLIIYAHNMRDGSMFASIIDYKDKNFFESNPIIYFDTNYKRGKYKVFAAFSTKVGSSDEFEYHKHTQLGTTQEYDAYVQEVKRRSFYDTGITPVFGDQLLTLSTCSYGRSNERTVVVAKRVSN